MEQKENIQELEALLGKIGYIKTKKLSNVESIRDKMDDEKLTNVQILEQYNTVNSSYDEITIEEGKTAITTPNLFNINSEFEVNSVIDLGSQKFKSYSEWINAHGINICADVTFEGSMNKLCSSYNTRTYVINDIYDKLVKNQIRMVCIDFNEIDDIEGFYRFISEMVPRYKEAGIKVIVKSKDGLNKDRLR